jgi:hypothetical protein
MLFNNVIPAQAGIQRLPSWFPTCAGMTLLKSIEWP